MTAVADNPVHELVAVDSALLGAVSVASSAVFDFPTGLHGFETHTRFALIPAAREALYWMQSMIDRNIAFLLVDPFVAAQGYEIDLGPTERASLRLADSADALVLATVTLPAGEKSLPTANLRGPIVFNAREHVGQQVVSAREDRDLRTPVDINVLPKRAGGVAIQ